MCSCHGIPDPAFLFCQLFGEVAAQASFAYPEAGAHFDSMAAREKGRLHKPLEMNALAAGSILEIEMQAVPLRRP